MYDCILGAWVKRETVLRILEGRCAASRSADSFLAARYSRCAMRIHAWFALSLMMVMASIVSVFIFIPVVSAYAFWMAVGAYIILASSLKWWFPVVRRI
jgi:hypothetical protein